MMRAPRGGSIAALLPLLAGCVTGAQLAQRDQQMIRYMREQRRQLEAVQREVERLRGDMEGRPPGSAGGTGPLEDRVAALEQHVYDAPSTLSPTTSEGVPPGEPIEVPAETAAPVAPASRETPLMAGWTGAVESEIRDAAASGAPERDAYVEAMQGLSGKDCGPAVAKLDAFAAQHRESSLADNALYWAARCYVLMGDATPGRSTEFYNQAISKFYDVGTSYPKGEKTPAALFEQGELFIRIGDVPDARIVFSRLIREHPSSPEAAAARQKLVDLGA